MIVVKILIGLYVFGFLLCSFVNYKVRKEGYSGIGFQCLNPVKWISFCTGYILRALIPAHVVEQYVLRFYDDQCRQCVAAKQCVAGESPCGCSNSKIWVPWEICSNHNFGGIIWSKKKYLKHREEFPVEILVNYGKKV